MNIFILAFVIVGMIYIFSPDNTLIQNGGGLELRFSDVPAGCEKTRYPSWAKKMQPRPQYRKNADKIPTYWGTPLPLARETRVRPFYGQRIPTVSAQNYVSKPECCPSTYSSSSGCVCYDTIHKMRQLKTMDPKI